jgi:NTP pyrophosphatase (non-canonical NTP hydrolase)
MAKVEIEPRPAVLWFAQQLEARLREYDEERGESGWQRSTWSRLRASLRSELDELEKTLDEAALQSTASVIEKLADVANYCMMIADLLRRFHGDSADLREDE